MRRDVFRGIADPTRREILNMIAHKSLNINSVAGNFSVSRTAIGKHMKILSECGLVTIHERGRERYYEARLERLNEVSDWIEQYKKSWNEKFNYLEQYLRGIQNLSINEFSSESQRFPQAMVLTSKIKNR